MVTPVMVATLHTMILVQRHAEMVVTLVFMPVTTEIISMVTDVQQIVKLRQDTHAQEEVGGRWTTALRSVETA